MSNEVYIDFLPGLIRAARMEEDRLEALLMIRADKPQVVGNQYVGCVAVIDRGLGAAFVDIGLKQHGFLPLQDIPKALGGGNINEGDYLCVEAVREAFDDKGVRLRARVKSDLPGKVQTLKTIDRLRQWILGQKQEIDCIHVTDARIAQEIRGYLPELKKEDLVVNHVVERPDLFEREAIEEQIEQLFQIKIPLPSGGSLLFEQGRTLTAIDVNKGTMQHNSGSEMLHYVLNLEAVEEIGRQLRLRNVAGRIMIDFPYMKLVDHQKKLQANFKAVLKKDGVGHKLLPLYMTGVQELTRKRAGLSLQDLLLEPVGIGGLGQEKAPFMYGMSALRRLWSESIYQRSSKARIVASNRVIEFLSSCAALPYVEEKIGTKISLYENSAWTPDNVILFE
ncbi:ribonuclease E/G [Kiloniella sp. EL199]|uniref:ribonuclease E/G n=1 Tax=Kiloniella sp. EL199 TaxID=2107581 RepID=UPI000EA354F5|nr:ribonuclease E/G [Kiloniella sp. EL199]